MNDTDLEALPQVREFLDGSKAVHFDAATRTEAYEWLARTLKRFGYGQLSKQEKGTVWAYMAKVSGYSRAHLNRLIKQYQCYHWIGQPRRPRNCFKTHYTREDILLLAETDECHQIYKTIAILSFFISIRAVSLSWI